MLFDTKKFNQQINIHMHIYNGSDIEEDRVILMDQSCK